nr:hypothetical protein Q903MT_gene4693 [Picea sitchensis]
MVDRAFKPYGLLWSIECLNTMAALVPRTSVERVRTSPPLVEQLNVPRSPYGHRILV